MKMWRDDNLYLNSLGVHVGIYALLDTSDPHAIKKSSGVRMMINAD